MAPEAETIAVAVARRRHLPAGASAARPAARRRRRRGRAPASPSRVLQVGALLLPVVAPAAAVVVDAAVEDGTLVGFGDRLFDLPPQD